jgi:hypothetical protein
VPIAQLAHPPVDLSATSRLAREHIEIFSRRATDDQPDTVRRQDVQLFDGVGSESTHERVHTARVIADHAAQGAPAVGGGIRAVHQAIGPGRALQVVEHETRLDACGPAIGIDGQDAAQVP